MATRYVAEGYIDESYFDSSAVPAKDYEPYQANARGLTDVLIDLKETIAGTTLPKVAGFIATCFEDVYQGIIKLSQANKKISKPIKIALDLRIGESLETINKFSAFKQLKKLIKTINYQYNYYSWGGMIKQSDLLGHMKLIKPKLKNTPCSIFYADGPTVLWDGKVTVCGCRELNADSDLILGDIMKDSLKDLWQGDKITRLRSEFWEGKLPLICKSCCAYNSVEILRTLFFFKQAIKNLNRD